MEGVSSHTNTEKSHTNVTSLLNTRDTMRKCETLKKEFRDHTIRPKKRSQGQCFNSDFLQSRSLNCNTDLDQEIWCGNQRTPVLSCRIMTSVS